MRIRGSFIKGLLIALVFTLMPVIAFSAQKVSAGSSCKVYKQKTTYQNKVFTCIKSGKKLVWNKGAAVVKPTPSPTPTPTPSPSSSSTTPTAIGDPIGAIGGSPSPTATQVFYEPIDKTTIYKFSDLEGCAVAFDGSGTEITFPTLWALVGNQWLQVKTKEIGWEKTCNDSRLPNNRYFAYAKAAVDNGTKIRWKFVGPVNIRERDEQGNGYSQPIQFTAPPKPIEPLVPHPVEGGYGITWQNITERVNDISAAAWTDAQLSLIRNKDLPNVGQGLTTYISPYAAKLDNKLYEVNAILNRTFTLFARIPASPKIFFVATTYEDAAETKEVLKGIYSNSAFMRNSIDSIYALDQNPLAGSPFVYSGCGGNYYGRNTFTWPNTLEAQALILGVCPGGPESNGHFEAVQGMSHEYIHLIQIGLRPSSLDTFANIPCWMVEGEAEWGQTAVATDFTNYLRGQHFHPYLLTSAGRDFQQTTAREWTAQEVQSYYLNAADPLTCHDINQYAYSYSLGAATVEALVSIGGSESIFAFHERLVVGETVNDAFKTVYGITWDVAAPILAQVVAKKITMSWSDSASTYQTRPKI